MAHLTKQQYTVWVDRKGNRVEKGSPGAKQETRESSKWYAANLPRTKKGERIPLSADKRTAERMLVKMVELAELGRDPREALKPLAEDPKLEPLVAEFETVIGREASAKHTRTVVGHVRQVLEACRLQTVSDLKAPGVADRVEQYVKSLATGKDALTGATAAYFGKHARQFTRWLWRKKELLDRDPLAGVDLPSQEVTNPRRAFTPEELAALIHAAEDSADTFRGLRGPDRAILYLTAVATGYRAEELSRLMPVNFNLDADIPIVWLKAKQTKNRKPAEQPLPPAVSARLRLYLADRTADRAVWPGSWWERAADMLRLDLAAAKVPEVVNDEEGVFHSLRHSYTSLLAEFAPVKVTQELSRHSTPVLTLGRYTHAGMDQKAEAVARLPLPGANGANSPLTAMTRSELEDAVVTLAFVVRLLLTPPLTPDWETSGDSPGPAKTTKRRKAAA